MRSGASIARARAPEDDRVDAGWHHARGAQGTSVCLVDVQLLFDASGGEIPLIDERRPSDNAAEVMPGSEERRLLHAVRLCVESLSLFVGMTAPRFCLSVQDPRRTMRAKSESSLTLNFFGILRNEMLCGAAAPSSRPSAGVRA
jgi:hypothetical protein